MVHVDCDTEISAKNSQFEHKQISMPPHLHINLHCRMKQQKQLKTSRNFMARLSAHLDTQCC